MASNYDLVVKKLAEVGANFHESLNNADDNFEADLHLELWEVHGRGLIVAAHDDGRCGLYQFVGLDGDPVEEDLKFIERFAKYSKDLQDLKNSLKEATKDERELVNWREQNA